MGDKLLQLWDLWYPKGGATGVPFARGRLDPTEVLWVHAAPEFLTVEVVEGGRVIATGKDLSKTADRPMARLVRRGDLIEREDRWPAAEDLGAVVILPGGEVGTLCAWWNAPDASEWRWQIEFYNHR